MCGCGAHNALVDCTCNCDHTEDRMLQWKERALLAESQVKDGRETFDVKDRLAVFTYDSRWTGDAIRRFLELLQPTADNLREAGAIAVLVISSDVTLKTLDEHLLTELGLQRIPETP
jgi:hypothetical protein